MNVFFIKDSIKYREMKKFLLIIALLTGVGMISARDVEQYKVEVGQFDKLKVLDKVNVVYRSLPDSTGWVQYSGSKEFADAFIITPKNGTLKIQVSTEDVGNSELPTLYVYSDFLTSIENSSSFTLMVENPAPCAEFSAKEIGNGKIIVEGLKANIVKAALNTGNGSLTLSGSCREAEFHMFGTGVISADRLKAQTVQCKNLGSGSIGCWAEEKLNVMGLGSTKIYYKGDPVIKKTGTGKLFPLSEGQPVEIILEEEAEQVEAEEE